MAVTSVPMHPNAARPSQLYLNPGMTLEDQIAVFTQMVDAGGWGSNRVEPYARCITITPQLAEHILKTLPEGVERNRKRSPRKMKQYTRDMEAGGWMLTGQPIIFSRTGRLLDGGNRLSAVVMSGKKIRTLAVFGVFDETFVQLDNGRNRTKKDIYDILGIADSSIKSKAVRWVYLLTEGKCGPALSDMPASMKDRNWKPDNAAAMRLWRERFGDDKMFEWACVVAKSVAKKTGRVTDKATLAALIYIYAASVKPTEMPKRCQSLIEFAQSMASIGKRASRPGAKLVKRLHEKLKAADGRLHENVRIVMTARAIEAHLDHAAPSFSNIDSETDPPKLPKVPDEAVNESVMRTA